MKKSKKQSHARQTASGSKGLKQAITVAAAVASLGASLGVNVGDILAADVKPAASSEYLKLESNQHKGESNQLKIESNQHKGESRQLKYESIQHKGESDQLKVNGDGKESFIVKLHGQSLKNGDRVIIGDSGKVFIRSRSGKQTPALDKMYELQDGTKFSVKGGKIIQ